MTLNGSHERLAGRNLSDRELEVLQHAADGLTDTQAARQLGITRYSVKTLKHRMFAKLGAENITHAVAIAHRRGLLGLDDDIAATVRMVQAARERGMRLAVIAQETP